MRMRPGTPGRSSELRFRKERRERLRANWRDLALLVGALIACVVFVALDDGWRQLVAAIFVGAFATLLTVGWMIGFDARLLRYGWGAAGEKWTAEELQKLESPWQVFHDLPDGRGNWDHIAVDYAFVVLEQPDHARADVPGPRTTTTRTHRLCRTARKGFITRKTGTLTALREGRRVE